MSEKCNPWRATTTYPLWVPTNKFQGLLEYITRNRYSSLKRFWEVARPWEGSGKLPFRATLPWSSDSGKGPIVTACYSHLCRLKPVVRVWPSHHCLTILRFVALLVEFVPSSVSDTFMGFLHHPPIHTGLPIPAVPQNMTQGLWLSLWF